MRKRPKWALGAIRETRRIDIEWVTVEGLIEELGHYPMDAQLESGEDYYGRSTHTDVVWWRDMTGEEEAKEKKRRAKIRADRKQEKVAAEVRERKQLAVLAEKFGATVEFEGGDDG